MPSYFFRGTRRATVEEALTLDLSRMLKDRSIIPGAHVKGQRIWISTRTGEQTAAIEYEADLRNANDAWVRLLYAVNGDRRDYRVYLTTTRPNYGGLRWWFICPVTGGRAYTLHSVGGRNFASQKALDLGYLSQQESKLFASLTRAQKIRARLGGTCDVTDMFPNRPKGQWRKTYDKHRRDFAKAMDAMNEHIGGRFTL